MHGGGAATRGAGSDVMVWRITIADDVTCGTTARFEQRVAAAASNFEQSVGDFVRAGKRHAALVRRWLAGRALEVRGLMLARRLPSAPQALPARRGRACSLAEAWRVRGPP